MRSSIIEGFLKIPYTAIEYSLSIKDFEKAVKYVVKNIFELDETNFTVSRVNTINHVVIVDIDDCYKDIVCRKLLKKEYSFACENEIKKLILKNIFGDFKIEERTILKSQFKPSEYIVRFKIFKDFQSHCNGDKLDNKCKIDLLNKQISVLEEKKLALMNKK